MTGWLPRMLLPTLPGCALWDAAGSPRAAARETAGRVGARNGTGMPQDTLGARQLHADGAQERPRYVSGHGTKAGDCSKTWAVMSAVEIYQLLYV